MGGYLDPRRLLRTPGFAEEGLYDEQDDGLPPLPDRIAQPDEQPSRMGLSGMIASAPATVAPIRDLPQQQRQRITLPDAPLPPKVGKMRQILGTATELYLPQVGQAIRQPGYDRAQKEYANKVGKLQMEAKLNEAAAQEESHGARTRAEMARAEAQAALKRRTEGQMASDGDFSLPGGQVRYGHNGRVIASNPLPPKPTVPGMKITPDAARQRGLYVEEGATNLEIPASGSSAYLSTLPRADRGYDTLKQSVRDANPDWEQADVDAEAAKQYKAKAALDADVKRHTANRPYGKTGGMTATGQATEARRTTDERAKGQIAEAGSLDKAISNMSQWQSRDEEAEKVLAHLKAMKGGQLSKPDTKAKGLRGLKPPGSATTTPVAPAKPTGNTPAIGTEKGGYRFKGGDPASPSSWEKM